MSKDLKLSIRVNGHITAREIRLINSAGDMVGVTSVATAINMARDAGLDLVEISPNAAPPVCKIMDYGKYKYELQKKAQEAKRKQKVVETKEIKLRPNIAEGDYQVKLRNANKFIAEGDKVRVSLMFRGREIAHSDIGIALMDRLKKDLELNAKIEVEPKFEGRQIFMVVVPKV
ncbi:MAG: translation initiation factor IF-3 [Proteobacteria bacterium]|nr:translation initiation factor IF-3 [Pseudomonadota bacterium]